MKNDRQLNLHILKAVEQRPFDRAYAEKYITNAEVLNEPFYMDHGYYWSYLGRAILLVNLEAVEFLLEKGQNPNMTYEERIGTSFHPLIDLGRLEIESLDDLKRAFQIAIVLLKAGADPNIIISREYTNGLHQNGITSPMLEEEHFLDDYEAPRYPYDYDFHDGLLKLYQARNNGSLDQIKIDDLIIWAEDDDAKIEIYKDEDGEEIRTLNGLLFFDIGSYLAEEAPWLDLED